MYFLQALAGFIVLILAASPPAAADAAATPDAADGADPKVPETITSRCQEFMFRTIPQQRIGECEGDIGRFVALLCSDDCAYINGQSIAVDGGQAYLG